jgi:hypothetical protein
MKVAGAVTLPCRDSHANRAASELSRRSAGSRAWSGRGDSNPRLQLGKLSYYPYTTAAKRAENGLHSYSTPFQHEQDPFPQLEMTGVRHTKDTRTSPLWNIIGEPAA